MTDEAHTKPVRHPDLSEAAKDFLAGIGKSYPASQVVRYLKEAQGLRVLLVGETIVDDYHYCETLGKSGKEPILAVRYKSSEQFAGGVIAVANHVAGFCRQVDVITALGDENTQEEFIRSKLNPRIRPTFLYQAGTPTIVKRRFIEHYPFQKMFEVYMMDEDRAEEETSAKLCRLLEERLPDYDLVIVADYGHHLIGDEAVERLSKKARWLAINTQANAANHGFNTVSKYPRADYVSISEMELRLEARRRREDLHRIVREASSRLGAPTVLVTRGGAGMLCYDGHDAFVEAPALAGHFKDRVGAGDTVLAVTSLCACQRAPLPVLALLGNAVGALAINTVGNRNPIDPVALQDFVLSLLS